MAAEVSSLLHLMADSKQRDQHDRDDTNHNLITRDFLGTCTVIQSNQLINSVVQQQPRADIDSALDLKLLPSSASRQRPLMNYQSVCTLDKVRSALERAGRESQSKRSTSPPPTTPSSSSSSSSSSMIRRRSDDGEIMEKGERIILEGAEYNSSASNAAGMIAGGCPRCLMYVLISRGNPRCPRCDSHVPVRLPVPVVVAKKPRLDLN